MANKTIYKIRLKGTELYSMGAIKSTWGQNGKCYMVDFTSKINKGKEWRDETHVKEHLFKFTKLMSLPESWEIVKVSTEIIVDKPVEEWFDATMTMKLLKR